MWENILRDKYNRMLQTYLEKEFRWLEAFLRACTYIQEISVNRRYQDNIHGKTRPVGTYQTEDVRLEVAKANEFMTSLEGPCVQDGHVQGHVTPYLRFVVLRLRYSPLRNGTYSVLVYEDFLFIWSYIYVLRSCPPYFPFSIVLLEYSIKLPRAHRSLSADQHQPFGTELPIWIILGYWTRVVSCGCRDELLLQSDGNPSMLGQLRRSLNLSSD